MSLQSAAAMVARKGWSSGRYQLLRDRSTAFAAKCGANSAQDDGSWVAGRYKSGH
jgi:hypothetical protein